MSDFAWPFDAEALSSVPVEPSPGPDVRSWQWLLENLGPRAQDYLSRLAEQGIEPEFGVNRCASRQFRLEPVEDELVRAEFAEQHIIFRYEANRFRLAPAPGPIDGVCPITAAVGFVSRHRRLEEPVERLALWPAPQGWPQAGALEAGWRWTDRMVVSNLADVLPHARLTEQPYYVRWMPGAGHGDLEVVEVGSAAVISRRPAILTRAYLTCPMIKDAACGQLCRMYGGPWVSRSVHAAAHWSANYASRVVDVGCDTCGDGAVTIRPGGNGPRLMAGLGAPVTIDIATGRHMYPEDTDLRWPTHTRYGRLVGLD